jgi:hypothetical protein
MECFRTNSFMTEWLENLNHDKSRAFWQYIFLTRGGRICEPYAHTGSPSSLSLSPSFGLSSP